MSNWTDPTGDDYEKDAADQDPGAPNPPPSRIPEAPGQAYPSYGTGQSPPPGPPAYGAPGSSAPGYGAPGSSAPGYGAPGSGPPGYGAPGSGAPGYGAPGQPPSGQQGGPPQQGPYPGYGPAPGYPGTGPGPYAPPQESKTSSIVLLVVSIVFTFFGCGLGLPSLILAIIALARANQDPSSAKRMTRIGWVVFAIALAIALVVVGILVVLGVTNGTSSYTSGTTY